MAKLDIIPSLSVLRAFEAFGRLGSVRKAALDIGIDHAAVSRHLRTLEQAVNHNIIERRGNQYCLSEVGQRYYQQVSQALHQLSSATSSARNKLSDALIIWVSLGFASQWLSSRLSDFLIKHPEIPIEIRPTNSRADFLSDKVSAQIVYCLDSDKKISREKYHVTEIARPCVFPVVSPEFLTSHGSHLKCIEDLLALPMLHLERTDYWRAWFISHGVTLSEESLPGPRLWSSELLLNAARDGSGIAFANPFFIGNMIKSGDLVKIKLPGLTPDKGCIGSYYFITDKYLNDYDPIIIFQRWLNDNIKTSSFNE